mmetsp:Transcript_36964/g.91976  ORF Transcript_36964/g.91976 Transcript_36964/m.91976 type:complete len:112 (-) Transcript_36964:850-1185(-)
MCHRRVDCNALLFLLRGSSVPGALGVGVAVAVPMVLVAGCVRVLMPVRPIVLVGMAVSVLLLTYRRRRLRKNRWGTHLQLRVAVVNSVTPRHRSGLGCCGGEASQSTQPVE